MLLDKKCSIITGGSRGIGKAIAMAFAKQGSDVLAVSRSENELKLARKEILILGESAGARVETCKADVSNEGDVRNLVDFALAQFGTVDILVNAAGIYGPIGLITNTDAKKWIETIHVNLFGTFLCMKAVLPIMMRKTKGKIINLSGGGASTALPRFAAYASSKVGVVRLTETAAEEMKDYKIDINAIAPGPVNTRLLDQVLEAGEAAGRDFLAKAIRQKQEGGVSPEKAAALAVFLASSRSDGLTGRLISAVWDEWQPMGDRISEIMSSDAYTLRRISPEADRVR